MEQKYAFRERMCEVHRPFDPAMEGSCPAGCLDLSRGACVILTRTVDAVTLHAADDLCDYFRVSRGVPADTADNGRTPIRLLLAADSPETAPSGSEERAYRITVAADGITVTANSGKGLFAGTVYLEEQMSEAEGPFLKLGEVDRRPLFSPRMVHSGYELDVF
ncbi:MAG: hypothetical protein J6S41_06565, partial [Clostridia bacterium]|nr:hypothetical protein [Clostridia bacterium]